MPPFPAPYPAKKQAETDNLALYGKFRYLQHKEGGGRGLGGSLGAGSSPAAMRIRQAGAGEGGRVRGGSEAVSDDVEAHYEKIYEHRLNPFAEFSQQERQRRLGGVT